MTPNQFAWCQWPWDLSSLQISSGLDSLLLSFEAVIFGTIMGKRRASEGLLQPCSRRNRELQSNVEAIDEVENTESNMAMSELKAEGGDINLCGIPLAPSFQTAKSGAIFVLEKASLVLAHVGKRYQILSSDEHAGFLRRKNLNPYDYRPDIVHEALLEIMDSRLRMAGRLKAIYIRTDDGALIKVEPNALIPRSLKEFCNMMAELRQKFSIKAAGNKGKLLRLLKNPVTQYLPVNSRKIGLSCSSEKAVNLRDYVSGIGSCDDVVFVVGAMAHGRIECDYMEDLISVSHLHLSAAVCLSCICIAMERKWGIL